MLTLNLIIKFKKRWFFGIILFNQFLRFFWTGLSLNEVGFVLYKLDLHELFWFDFVDSYKLIRKNSSVIKHLSNFLIYIIFIFIQHGVINF